jgi:excisionase family DNA binding protein
MEKLLKVQDVVDTLNVSAKTARLLIANGEIPAARIGRGLRIKPEALSAYVDRNAVAATQPAVGELQAAA